MSHSVKISDQLYVQAGIYSKIEDRSVPKQIEYWSKIGKIAEENPDLTYNIIKEILLAKAEIDAGEVSEYKFG